ncbi:MAG TPA: condensation domain-containing protein, partial [Pyrinomonadaceae bacterium]
MVTSSKIRETVSEMPPRIPGEVSRSGASVTSTDLSPAQERLWFLTQINPDTAATVARAVSLSGPLNRDVLERGLQSLVNRHESLRTTFATTQLYAGIDSKPVQLVADSGSFPLDLVDISGTLESEVQVITRERLRHKFDLSLGPLVRATLMRVNEQFHILLVTAHRIIADEESLKILMRELWQVYAARGELETAELSSTLIQYADFAADQLNWLQTQAAANSIDYWRRSLTGAPFVELPGDRTSSSVQTATGANISSVVDQTLTPKLRALADREEVTLRTVLLAAFTILLSRYSRQEEIVVGLQLTNRDQERLHNLVGPVSNLLPLRIDLSPRDSFARLLHRLAVLVLESGKHASVPFEKLLHELNVERSLSRPPLVQVTFDFKDAKDARFHATGLDIEDFPIDGGINNFEITLDVVSCSDHLECRFGYNEQLYKETLIERLQAHFQVLLDAIVQDPSRKISELPLLTDLEREQMLVEWNQTAVTYPQGQCLHELFEAQVERTPQALAVADEKQQLSYADVERRANQLAWRLRREGVGCESLVAVCLERSVDLVVALLGILKAGGAYVPLDPSYPESRLRFMLEDTQAAVVLTEQHLAMRLPVLGNSKQLWLDAEKEQLVQESSERPERLSQPESLGYVIYTSGSTGRPKGVAIEQRSTVALLQWAQEVFGPADLKAVLASTSICFDL